MLIAMPKILMDKLGNDGADALLHVLNDAETKTRTDLVTKWDLKVGLAEIKADLLKWMFIFWTGQAAVTVGIMLAFLQMAKR